MLEAAQLRNRTVVRTDSTPALQVGAEVRNIVKKAAAETLLMEKSEDCEVSVFLTDDVRIRELNESYRSVDRATDVLAFAMRESVDGKLNQELLGDVVISVPTAERQAGSYGHSLKVEMSLLVSHGVLHLLGYEHEGDDEADVMRQKQEEVLRLLGCDLTELNELYHVESKR